MALYLTRTYTQVHIKPGSSTTTNAYPTEVLRDERSATVKRPRGSWRAPTSYSRRVTSGDNETFGWNGVVTNKKDNEVFICTGYQNASGGYSTPIVPFPQSIVDQCVTRALSKLKSANVNFAQSIGERAQTAKLVGNNFSRVASIIGAVASRDWRRLKQELRPPALHDAWLEAQYGIRPLYGEIYGAVKELYDRESILDRVRATVTAKQSDNFVIEGSVAQSGPEVNWLVPYRIRGSHKCFVRLDYVQNDNCRPLADWSRLGITNPLLLAWELLPWSFVVDWAIPIGGYFNTLDAALGWEFKGGSVSKKTTQLKRAQTARVHPMHGQLWWLDGTMQASGEGKDMYFSRLAYSSSPLPHLPRFNTNASAEHVANGIALLNASLTKLMSKQ